MKHREYRSRDVISQLRIRNKRNVSCRCVILLKRLNNSLFIVVIFINCDKYELIYTFAFIYNFLLKLQMIYVYTTFISYLNSQDILTMFGRNTF